MLITTNKVIYVVFHLIRLLQLRFLRSGNILQTLAALSCLK